MSDRMMYLLIKSGGLREIYRFIQNMSNEFERQGEENADLYKASLQDFTKYVSMLKDYARLTI